MAVFEMESWHVAENKEKEHKEALRTWLKWVNEHRELFKEWKSVRYFVKYIAGEESDRHFIIWEYDSLADFEAYKKRRADYKGPYAEYKKADPYYQGVFDHSGMKIEIWKDIERDLWIEDSSHLPSYYAGSIATAVEFVSYGCKKLALSAPFKEEMLKIALPHARREAEKYNIPMFVEKNLLVTKLFSPDAAKNKTVIMFAYKQKVLDEYLALKAFKAKAEKEGKLAEVEKEIARKFGKLLSYTGETIEKMLAKQLNNH
jgi:hypothetical protein